MDTLDVHLGLTETPVTHSQPCSKALMFKGVPNYMIGVTKD